MEKKGWPLEPVVTIRSFPSSERSFERIDSSHGPTTDAKDTEEWPAETHTLEERQRDWTVVAYDTALVILPVLILAKAILAATLGNSQKGGQDLDTTPVLISYLSRNLPRLRAKPKSFVDADPHSYLSSSHFVTPALR